MPGQGKTNWVLMPDGTYWPHIRFREGLLMRDGKAVGRYDEFRKPFWENLPAWPSKPVDMKWDEHCQSYLTGVIAYRAVVQERQKAETEALKEAGYTVRIGWVLQPC